jgi:hypothetical protein
MCIITIPAGRLGQMRQEPAVSGRCSPNFSGCEPRGGAFGRCNPNFSGCEPRGAAFERCNSNFSGYAKKARPAAQMSGRMCFLADTVV